MNTVTTRQETLIKVFTFCVMWTVYSSCKEVARQECKVKDNRQIIVEVSAAVAKQEYKAMDRRQIRVEYNT